MKRKFIILGVILLIAINVSVLATVGYYWRCGRVNRSCGGCAPGEYICLHLDLSDSQKQKMETFKKVFDEKTDTIREALSHKRNELVGLLSEPFPDRAKIDSLVNQIGTAQMELEKEVIEHLLQEKQILTSEQQKKFLDLIKGRLLPAEKCEEVICPGERR